MATFATTVRQTTDAITPEWAWDAFRPTPQDPWDLRKAAHLLRRVGWTPTWAEIEQVVQEGPEKSVDRLTHPGEETEAFDNEFQSLLERATRLHGEDGLRAWWLRRMIQSPFPFREKLVLFWHSHFAVAASRVKDPLVMLDYLRRLESVCLSSWPDVLGTVICHPAVLLSAGATAHRRGRPDSAWGRYFLTELVFGENGQRIAQAEEVARVWTGWFVMNKSLRFVPSERDPRPKRILGVEGDIPVEQLVSLVTGHPASQQYLVRKLFRFFVSEEYEPSAELLQPLQSALAAGESVADVVRRILRSNLFFSAVAYRGKVKSPVELAVGLARMVQILPPTAPLGAALAGLGQDLCEPPTTQGWPGGRAWIHPASYLARKRLVVQMLEGSAPYTAPDLLGQAERVGKYRHEEVPEFLIQLFYQDDLQPAVRDHLLREWGRITTSGSKSPREWVREFAIELAKLPEFELC
jgi:uncharacterized protein (DUF1800 family)